MNIPELKLIEMALRHPGDHISFPPLPGESPSSHRRRLEAWAVVKIMKMHNPDLPLPTEGLAPKGFIRNRNQKTNTMSEHTQNEAAPQGDLMAMLTQMQKQLEALSKSRGGRPKGSKTKKHKSPFPGLRIRAPKNNPGLGGAVEAIRLEKLLPTKELSARSGVHTSVISGVERRGSRPNLDTIMSLAKGLGVKTSELFAKAEERDAQRAGRAVQA